MRTAITWCSLSLVTTAFAGVTDSTEVSAMKGQTRLSAYLLAQGKLESNKHPQTTVYYQGTTSRCHLSTTPSLITSLINTYENSFYSTGGIVNTLTLSDDYELTGKLYMSNRGAAGDNSYSSIQVNWQIWCNPKDIA